MPTQPVKKHLKILLIICLLFLTVGGGIIYYFYKNVKPILEQEINKSLAVQVKFSEIKVSGMRDFPKLGITFSGVKIDESTPHYRQKLLVATELSLFLDVLKLWKGEYVIDAITLRNGQLNLADLKKGTNYDIIKPSSETSSNSVSFEIKNLTLVDCKIVYQYVQDDLKFESFVPKAKIKLKYLENKTEFGVKTQFNNTFLSYSGEKYIVNRNVKLNTKLDLLSEKSFLAIAASDITVEDIALKTSGTFYYGNAQKIDLKFESNNTKAQSLLSILPESTQQSLQNLKITGNVQLAGILKGQLSASKSPSFMLDYKLENASLAVSGQSISLNDVNAIGKLEMPSISELETAKSTCSIKQLKSGENLLNGELQVTDFNNPHIAWKGIADLDAPFITSLANSSDFTATSGRIKVKGELKFNYNTSKQEIEENSFYYAGVVEGRQIGGSLSNPDIKIKSIDFNISADNTKMSVNELTFSYNDVQGKVIGYISNYHSLLSADGTSELVGKLDLENLNLNDLVSAENTSASKKASANSVALFPFKINLNSRIINFKYNEFTAREISGNLIANEQQVAMPECKLSALEGEIAASVLLKKWGDNYLLDINSNITDVSITELFRQFNDFDQEEITHKNLTGKLSGNILAKIILDGNFEPILPKLYAKANVTISNGQLKNYEPLKSLSDFVEVQDLEDVKFKTLQNTIEIFDETIFIPKMKIENSALNLQIEGTHTFDNYMNYHMSLSVAELLASKANWIAKKKERRIENNSNGGLTAYITMVGTPDNLKIAYDGATVKENVKEEMAKEKTNFIKALKGEATLEKETAESKNYDDVWDE